MRDANVGTSAGGDADRRAHLKRSRRVWDFWSDRYDFNERDTREIRAEAIETLDLEAGDTVLDVGCGPGVNFGMLRERVGPEGRIVGLDYSPKMIARARERVAENRWGNVEVVRADATRVGLAAGAFDGAIATLAMSVMPDVRAVVETVREALRPGGRFAVCDARPVPSGAGRVLNPLIRLFFRYAINRNMDADVPEDLDRVFGNSEVVSTHALGTTYVAVAERRG